MAEWQIINSGFALEKNYWISLLYSYAFQPHTSTCQYWRITASVILWHIWFTRTGILLSKIQFQYCACTEISVSAYKSGRNTESNMAGWQIISSGLALEKNYKISLLYSYAFQPHTSKCQYWRITVSVILLHIWFTRTRIVLSKIQFQYCDCTEISLSAYKSGRNTGTNFTQWKNAGPGP